MGFIEDYIRFLILQYYNKPKARTTIEALLTRYGKLADFFRSIPDALDVDKTAGVWLDVLGRIVGVPRQVPFAVPKNFFGFADNPLSGRFADKFLSIPQTYPFADKFIPTHSGFTLEDADYRQMIKLKIAKNNASAYLSHDRLLTIQDAVMQAFPEGAYVTDNLDMSLTLHVDYSYRKLLSYIVALDLLPRPQGVYYRFVYIYARNTLTFKGHVNARGLGFGDKFSGKKGGIFSRKVLI